MRTERWLRHADDRTAQYEPYLDELARTLTPALTTGRATRGNGADAHRAPADRLSVSIGLHRGHRVLWAAACHQSWSHRREIGPTRRPLGPAAARCVSERYESADQASGDAVGGLSAKMVLAEFAVQLAGREHAPHGREDRVPRPLRRRRRSGHGDLWSAEDPGRLGTPARHGFETDNAVPPGARGVGPRTSHHARRAAQDRLQACGVADAVAAR